MRKNMKTSREIKGPIPEESSIPSDPSFGVMPDSLTIDETTLAKAQQDLSARPTVSIRAKITLGFVLLFLLCAGVSITSLITVSRISQKLRVMETVNRYAFEIQQARRFEKNFFLYNTNLADALENVQNAREVLKTEGENIAAVIGRDNFTTMTVHLNRYQGLLSSLKVPPPGSAQRPSTPAQIEGELRQYGAEMVFMAANLADKERRDVDEMIRLSRLVPLLFLGLLLVLMIYETHFLVRQIVRPLNRFVDYTLRIARGNYTPIKPTRRYKDEFSQLGIAINWMMDQLHKHQEQYIQSRKLASIGTLTSGIAHELNNPLNNICITAESLIEDLDTISDEEKRKGLQDIYTQAERASGTVQNLLDFTRASPPAFASVSVRELLGSTLKLAGNEMKLNNIRLDYTPDLADARITGDFAQLQQVFINLVINATQSMPKGGILSIDVKENSEFVCVDVRDTGVGIPQSIIEQIFDPFFTTKENGTGLGLSTSYSIIKRHAGNIQVSSRLNEGSVFSVCIPRAKEP